MPEMLVRSTPSGKGRDFYLIVVILKSPNIDRFPQGSTTGVPAPSFDADDGAQVRSYGLSKDEDDWVQPSAGQSRYFEKKSYNYLTCKSLTEDPIYLAKRTIWVREADNQVYIPILG